MYVYSAYLVCSVCAVYVQCVQYMYSLCIVCKV